MLLVYNNQYTDYYYFIILFLLIYILGNYYISIIAKDPYFINFNIII